jgi:predicted acetyltransferase
VFWLIKDRFDEQESAQS